MIEESMLALATALFCLQDEPTRLEVTADRPVLLRGVHFVLTVTTNPEFTGDVEVHGIDGVKTVRVVRGVGRLTHAVAVGPVTVRRGHHVDKLEPRLLSPWWCLVPPLLAILLALLTREVVVALLAGIWSGSWIVLGPAGFFQAFVHIADTRVVGTLSDPTHLLWILFILLLGGLMGILSSAGAMKGMLDRLLPHLRSRRAGMLSTVGVAIVNFIDPYAGILISGNTMRPVTDRLRISREKLALLINLTAGAVAAVTVVSTWAVVEEQTILATGITDRDGLFDLFFHILPYSFYPLCALLLVALVSATDRDFGPMLRAEMRAITTGQIFRVGSKPMLDPELAELSDTENLRDRGSSAMLVIGTLVVLAFLSFFLTGLVNPHRPPEDRAFKHVLGWAMPYRALVWSAMGALILAFVSVLARKYLSFPQAMQAWLRGMKAMLVAVLVLVLAWALGDTCRDLSLGRFVETHLDEDVAARWLPAAAFLACAVIGYTMGSTWSSLLLLLPALAPMAVAHGEPGVFYGTLAAVLSGALLGGNLSPIAATTVLSSIGGASDLVDHVKTQAPYAALAGGAALFLGFLPAGFGVSPWLCLPLSLGATAAAFYGLSRKLPRLELD